MTLARKLQDTGAMTRRCLFYTLRNIDNLITMLFLPVMIMLLFVFVLGGAMQTGQESYITYALPGILLLTLGYGAGTTAVSAETKQYERKQTPGALFPLEGAMHHQTEDERLNGELQYIKYPLIYHPSIPSHCAQAA